MRQLRLAAKQEEVYARTVQPKLMENERMAGKERNLDN